jgi:RNA polymerase sigma-70 factor, ECF subfamily
MIDKRNKEYKPLMQLALKLARQLVKTYQDDPEDLAQTVMLKLLSIKQNPKSVTSGYLYTITRNCFIDRWRSSSREVCMDFVEHGDSDNLDFVLVPSVTQTLSDPFVRKRIQLALDALSQSQREVMELNIYGFSDQEIAQVLQIPIGTAKSRIYYGRRCLSQSLSA